MVSEKTADIIVVDDNLQSLKLLILMLDHQGYHARPVSSGKQALRAIHAAPLT